MSEQVDCVVIGAGVVGLAIARALAGQGRQVIVLERNTSIGEETSSRNSEVIHAGLYYATGSLKSRLCARGKALLYDYCARRHVPHSRCGKLIVATNERQIGQLAAIARQARTNGVDDLREVSKSGIARYEPAVTGIAALWSRSTGIIDSHALMQALQGDIQAADGIVATQTAVEQISVTDTHIRLQLATGVELRAGVVVNAAGHGAAALAESCTGTATYSAPSTYLARGNYFTYTGQNPFNALVYPLPEISSIGIHATLDLAGNLRFGPDIEWIDRIDYTVDPHRRQSFADAIRMYWPAIDDAALAPAYAGVRPKIAGPGEPPADFRIDIAAADDRRQLIHLFGIESPGLTSALAIGDELLSVLGSAS